MGSVRRCPICKAETDEGGPQRPFCSARCKDVDLGNWLTEAYRISRPMTTEEREEAEEAAQEDGQDEEEQS